MSENACIIKWKSYPLEFEGYLSNFIKLSNNYSELVTYIKSIYTKEIEEYSGDIVNEDDIVWIIDRAIKVVDNDESLSNLLLAKPDLSNILTSYTNKVVTNSKASFNLHQTDKLIPIVSADLNAQVQKHFTGRVFGIAYYDAKEGIRNPNNLKRSLIDYKNALFVVLQKYINLDPVALCDNMTDLCDTNLYNDVMKKVWQKLESNFKEGEVFEGSIYNPDTAALLEVIESFYILNNFDTFIKEFSKGLITVNDNKFETVLVSDDKYKLIEQHKKASSYEGNHSDQNADKEFSQIFRVFWESLQVRPGVHLTIKDLKKLKEYIKNSLNEHYVRDTGSIIPSKWLFLIDPQMQSFNMDISNQNMTDALIDALLNDKSLHKYLGSEGQAICKTVAEAFKTFKKHYVNFLNNQDLTIDDKQELERVMHFPRLFKQSVVESENRTQVTYDEKGNISVTSDSRLSVSKEGLTSKIQKSISDHVSNSNFAIYSPTLTVDVRAMDIFSERFLNFFNELTGLKLSRSQLERFCTSAEDIEKLFKFIDGFTHLVQTDIIKRLRYETIRYGVKDEGLEQRIINNFFKKLKLSDFYLDFSNIYVRDNRNEIIKVFDQNGNPQPIQITPNTIQQFKKNLTDFQKQLQQGAAANILVKFPGLTSPSKHTDGQYSSSNSYREHIAYRQDVAYTDGFGTKRVIKAVEMSPEEILTTAFCGEFFDSIVNFGTFYNQVDCYSDKVTIALTAYNAKSMITVNGNTKSFINLTHQELKDLWKKQRAGYYLTVKQNITKDLQKVFGMDQDVDFDTLIKHLETLNVSEFEQMVKNYNITHPNDTVNVVQEIHYSQNKKDPKCYFNNSLYFNIKECEESGINLDNYYTEGFEQFKDSLSSIYIPAKYRNKIFIDNNKETLFELFNLREVDGVGALYEFFGLDPNGNEKQGDFYWVQEGNTLSDTLVRKYFAMQALCADADLQITNKENVIHNGKVKQLSISKAYDENGTLTNAFYSNILTDQSERLIVGKKRNNAEVASYLPMDITSKYGVAKQSRIAVVKSKKQDLMNYNIQENQGQDVVDGSLETIGIAVEWENHSYPGKKIEDTKKVIGLVPTMYGFQQFKCADFALDNLRILDSHRNIDSASTNVRIRAKKMMQTGVFSQAFYNAYTNPEMLAPLGVEIVKYFGNQLRSLASIKCIDPENHIMEFQWTSMNVSSSESIPPIQVQVNNVYDLWEALGAEYTLEQKDGDWRPSNASMKAIALMISEYDPSVKERMTSKIIDVSANKSGITNINSADDVDNPEIEGLNTTLIDNTRWGMQQDYSHESDESSIPSLSQVISAVAFNGKNIKLVQDMYDTLASLTLLKARELGIRYSNDLESQDKDEFYFHKRLVEKLLSSLSTGAARSDALTLTREAKDVIDQIIAENNQHLSILSKDGALLPYSSPDIFYKLASDIISDLNKKSIRQTFNGVAIVQNPSHSVIGLYEDNQGNIYKKFDLLQLGRKRGVLADGVTPINLNTTEEEIMESALADARFTPQEIPGVEYLELEDWYSIEINGIQSEPKRIIHPKQLFELQEYIKQSIENNNIIVIRKHFGKTRDLKAPKVYFYTDSAQTRYQNLWLTEAVKNRLAAEKSGDKVLIKKSLQWYRANLEGLGSENAYYYATLSDFENGITTPAYGVTFVPGEQILPKVNKSAQMLGSYSMSDLQHFGPSYFFSQVRHKFGKINNLELAGKDGVYYKEDTQSILTVARNTDEIVYTQFNHPNISSTWEVENANIVAQDDICYFQDNQFRNLFAIPSRNAKVYKHIYGSKTIYYVVDETVTNEQIAATIDNIEGINAVYEQPATKKYQYYSKLMQYNKIVDTTTGNKDLDAQIKNYAYQMYQSFELGNYTISARIPSQSFQSFMANKTAAFMESGQNNGYINIFEMWFQGSDFDIKQYWCR